MVLVALSAVETPSLLDDACESDSKASEMYIIWNPGVRRGGGQQARFGAKKKRLIYRRTSEHRRVVPNYSLCMRDQRREKEKMSRGDGKGGCSNYDRIVDWYDGRSSLANTDGDVDLLAPS